MITLRSKILLVIDKLVALTQSHVISLFEEMSSFKTNKVWLGFILYQDISPISQTIKVLLCLVYY